MSIITYKDEIIKKNLIPKITDSIKYLTDTINTTSSVSYYNGEVNWSEIKSELDICLSDLQKYLNWLNKTSTNFSTNVEELEEKLNQVKVSEIQSRDPIVKKM